MTDHQPYPSVPPQPPTLPPTSPPSSAWTPASHYAGPSAYADPSPAHAGQPASPGGGGSGRSSSPRRALAALAVAATFAAGAGGVLVGAQLADDGSSGTSTNTSAASGQTVSTQPGPVTEDSTEPAAAVAAALSPAVVQITTGQGLGSGFIYDESGLILTAAHVTDGASDVEVRLADGTRLPGEVVGSDDSTDVAVVKVEPADDLPVAVLATGVQLQVGQLAVAIGSPFGLDQTVTAGIVSAIGRSTETPGGVIPAIQTDAPINSGNSGGALADRQGRVIGINDSIITGSSGSSGSGNVGIGFAIPIDIAKAVADRIVAGETTVPGFLGVEGADATGSQAGAAITSVQAGSPAAEAGIAADDVVTAVDGRKVSSMIDLAAAVRTKQPGDQVSLTVVRDGDERTVEVTLGTQG